jgi:hypothetical protein
MLDAGAGDAATARLDHDGTPPAAGFGVGEDQSRPGPLDRCAGFVHGPRRPWKLQCGDAAQLRCNHVPGVVAGDPRCRPHRRAAGERTGDLVARPPHRPRSGERRRRGQRLDRDDGAIAAWLAPSRHQRMPPPPGLEVAARPDPHQLDRRRRGRLERVQHRRDVALFAGRVAPECTMHEGQGAAGGQRRAAGREHPPCLRGPGEDPALEPGRGVAPGAGTAIRVGAWEHVDPEPRRDLRQEVSQHRAAVGDADPRRLFDFAEGVEGERGPPQRIDDALLVQEQLGEPPQRVAAVVEAIAQRPAGDVDAAQALDPGIGAAGGFVGDGAGAVVVEVDRLDAAGALERDAADHEPVTCACSRPTQAASVSAASESAAAMTASAVTPTRQSGVWPWQRAGGLRIWLHGAHHRSIRTTRCAVVRGA